MKDIYERLKSYEPLFGEYELVEFIGGGSSGWVYKVKQISRPSSFAALKVIPIPTNEYELHILEEEFPQKDLLKEKINKKMIKQIEEINALEMFEGNTHIVSYKLSSVKQYEEGFGFDILILMEYLQSLTQYLREHEISETDVIRLGIDLCSALEIMSKRNILHRDIKPHNIFYNEISGFKLGDFGISHSSVQEFYSSTVGTKVYAAPEIIRAEKIEAGDNRSDIYSLGLIMYQLLNDNKLPFFTDLCNTGEAFQKRLSNEPFPKIMNADPKLMSIIDKACAFNRNNRFNNEIEMRCELESLRSNSGIQNLDETKLPEQKNDDIESIASGNVKYYKIRRILLAVSLCIGLFIMIFAAIKTNYLSFINVNNPERTDSTKSVSGTPTIEPTVTKKINGDALNKTNIIPAVSLTMATTPSNTPVPILTASPTTKPTSIPKFNSPTPKPTINASVNSSTITIAYTPPAPTATDTPPTPTVADTPTPPEATDTPTPAATDSPTPTYADTTLTPIATDTPTPTTSTDSPTLTPSTDTPTPTMAADTPPTPIPTDTAQTQTVTDPSQTMAVSSQAPTVTYSPQMSVEPDNVITNGF